ncbi:MAG: PDZ domain-containing protein, partial [Betaproteobacteria bacterium]
AVGRSADLPRLFGGLKPGAMGVLLVFRRGATRDLTVSIGEFEAERPTRRAAAEPNAPPPAAKSTLGLGVSELTDAQKRELRLKGGVRVDSVEGPAARAGLREGDVILALDNTEVTDLRQFNATVQRLEKARTVTALVRRGEWGNYVVIRLARGGPAARRPPGGHGRRAPESPAGSFHDVGSAGAGAARRRRPRPGPPAVPH